ncbi:ABC transporter substrate-binding protein [Cohnella sp. WQ 127256]|uniref:ABC transporter substrate-binding protein n=1 Tax=Cohnella sp. WQ 127256 TaxID=2938790 RepID=UPI0021195F2D|nr:ABC transporter substrate-binding protein [Cohnella sp. WQ 127256]
MKRIGKLMFVLLALILVISACGGNSGKNGSNTDSVSSSGNQATGSEVPKNDSKEKITNLNVLIFGDGNTVKDLPIIQDAVNAHIKDLINVKVNMTIISPGDYVQKTNLLLSGNEQVDLMIVSPFFGYYSQVARGQLQPLDELIDQHGPDIKSVLGEDYLNTSRVNGKIYGVVPMKDMASGAGLTMRKDLVDKYGIDVTKIKSLEDMTAVFKVIKENEPGIIPLISGATGASMLYFNKWYDDLGDGLGVLPNFDNGMKVVNLFETTEYAEQLKLMREWYNKGYIGKDAATTKEVHLDVVKAGRAFSYFGPTKVGKVEQESNSTGRPMVGAEYLAPASTTSSVLSFMWAVPLNAKTPEKSMKLLNLMYKDKDLINLLSWGVEGTHYVKISDNVINYPEGITAANNPYAMGTKWQFGNSFSAYTLNGSDPDIFKKLEEFNKSAIKSKALGFSFDNSQVKTEIAAVTNVMNTYKNALEAGLLDPADKLPEYISKLKEAGIDKIIEEKQKQLDEWVKFN